MVGIAEAYRGRASGVFVELLTASRRSPPPPLRQHRGWRGPAAVVGLGAVGWVAERGWGQGSCLSKWAILGTPFKCHLEGLTLARPPRPPPNGLPGPYTYEPCDDVDPMPDYETMCSPTESCRRFEADSQVG